MLQTGTLYTLVNDKNSIVKKEPIENVYITFSQNGKSVLTVKTDNAGKFSFNLPIGSYQVTVSQGAGFRVFDLAGGAPFELTKDSKQNAFESWVLNPVYLRPEENPLVVLMRNIAQKANESAEKAKDSANEANTTVKKFKEDTVGSGKILKEGAYGVGGTILIPPNSDLNDYKKNGFYAVLLARDASSIKNLPDKIKTKSSIIVYKSSNTGDDCTQIVTHYNSTLTAIRTYYAYQDRWTNWHYIYNTQNTTIDSNGHLKAASPIIRLFDDRIEHNGQFTEEPQFRKIDTGIYQVFNTLGLAKEGWTVETPKDKHGKPYFHVIVQKTYDGAIISVHDEYDVRRKKKIKDIFGEEQEVEVVEKILGEARDIKPHERWIDLRFHEEQEEIEEEHDVM